MHCVVQQFLTPHCGAGWDELLSPEKKITHTQQYYTGDKDAVIHPDVIPTWTLNVGLGTSSTYKRKYRTCIQYCEAQFISVS